MATASSPTLSKLSGTGDFCSVAENSTKSSTTKGQPRPSAPEGPGMQSALRKMKVPFFQNNLRKGKNMPHREALLISL